MYRLSHNSFEDETQLLQFMRYGSIYREADAYVMLLARLFSEERGAESLRTLRQACPADAVVLSVNAARAMAIVPLAREEDLPAVTAQVSAAYREADLEADIAVSAVHRFLTEAVAMYNEARVSLDSGESGEDGVLRYVEKQADKSGEKAVLAEKITEYLKTGYASPDLSLSILAKTFGFSEVYMSQLFKEQTGENFTAYLETLRMSHACEKLLSGDDDSIESVATSVGYYSADTFRKAFKRRFGVTPTQWKESEKKRRKDDESIH